MVADWLDYFAGCLLSLAIAPVNPCSASGARGDALTAYRRNRALLCPAGECYEAIAVADGDTTYHTSVASRRRAIAGNVLACGTEAHRRPNHLREWELKQ